MLNPLLGSSLLKAGKELFLLAIESGALAVHLADGIKRLNQLYGEKVYNAPDLWQVEKLRPYLENLISIASTHSEILDNPSALLLLNPHTHWGANNVIRIEYRPEEYRLDIGPVDIHYDAFYCPVSFVFIDYQAVAYEWMLESDVPNLPLYRATINYIKDACHVANTIQTGFGMGYNYRSFMTPFNSVINTIEVSNAEDIDSYSSIYATDEYELRYGRSLLSEVEYVGWSFLIQPDLSSLTSEEAALVEEAWALLSTAETETERKAMWVRMQSLFEISIN